MCNELRTQDFCFAVNEEVELREDGKPDIVGAEDETEVLVKGADDAVYEAICIGDDCFAIPFEV